MNDKVGRKTEQESDGVEARYDEQIRREIVYNHHRRGIRQKAGPEEFPAKS